MRVSESVFLITGGSSGLGAACAQMALEAGACVVLADLRPPSDEWGRLAAQWPTRWAYAQTDVTQAASAQAAIDLALSRFARLDVLVNAAGIAPAEKIIGQSGVHRLESFARTVEINLIGSFNMMRLAAAAISAAGPAPGGAATESRGVIIHTASVAAYDGQIGQSAYAASKGGVVAMTLPAARELARERIRVMTIAPGIFETPMLLGMPAAVQESLGKTVPHPARLGQPSEYAALVRHIVENEYLNGEVIRLDGAIRMTPK